LKGLDNPLPTSQESKLYRGKKDYKPDHLCGAPESYNLHLSKLCSCPTIPTGLINNARKCIPRKIHQFKHICHKQLLTANSYLLGAVAFSSSARYLATQRMPFPHICNWHRKFKLSLNRSRKQSSRIQKLIETINKTLHVHKSNALSTRRIVTR
jgi:hypothetical protein